MHWANDALNHTTTTANPGNKSLHEMRYGTAAHGSPHLSFAQHTVAGRARRSRSLGPRAVFTSDQASTTQVTFSDAHAGKQGGRDEGRDLGGDASRRSAGTAAAGDVGTGRDDGASTSSSAGRDGRSCFRPTIPPPVLGRGFLTNSVRCLR